MDASGPDIVPFRRVTVAAWSMVIAGYLLRAVNILQANWSWVADQVPDDAFYYLEIGRHLGAGDGPTFDGLNQTNGFHPLWQVLVTPLTWLFPDDLALTKASLLLGMAFGLAAIVLVARLLQEVVGPAPAALGALVVVHAASMTWQSNGMESPVVVFLLALVAWSIRRFDDAGTPRSAVLVGVACGFLVLARIDMGLAVLLVPAALALRTRSLSPVRWWLVGGGVVVVPVIALDLAVFGHLLTVSGTIKLAWMADMAQDRWGGRATVGYAGFVGHWAWLYVVDVAERLGQTIFVGVDGAIGWLARWGLLVLSVAGGLAYWRTWPRSDGERAPLSGPVFALLVVVAVVGAKAAVDVVTLPIWSAWWYSAPQRVVAGFLVGLGLWQAVRMVERWAGGMAAVGLALVVVLAAFPITAWTADAADRPDGTSWQAALLQAGDWVAAEGPEGVYGAFDAGLLGYRLHGVRVVVNLDGLVNDYEHAELAMAGASTEELVAHNDVDYLVQRLDAAVVRDMTCASVLWQFPQAIGGGGSVAAGDAHESPVYVLDVRSCGRAA